MVFDRLSPLDAGFLHVEDSVTHMQIGTVSIFEGPPPAYLKVRDMIASNLPVVPRCRQSVASVPFDLSRPVWVDDPYFDVEHHVRQAALPRPGEHRELTDLVARVMTQPLNRARPLWEIWMVEGLSGDRWALILKLHHCMADGVSTAGLLGQILEATPDASLPAPEPRIPEPSPTPFELVTEGRVDSLSSPLEQAPRQAAQTLGRPLGRVLTRAAEVLNGLMAAAETLKPTSHLSLNGPVGPHRRWDGTSLPVSDVKAVRLKWGGTFNDVVLAAITSAFRELLRKRGESTDLPLRSLVPVSVRRRDERGVAVDDGTLTNRVSAVIADLPVQLADPVERLRSISDQMAALKDSRQAMAVEALTQLGGFAPPVLLSLACRLGGKLSQRSVNTITTNVPGPQIPLYAVGRRMLEVFPYVPLAMQIRLGVAIFSYDGNVSFGVTGDYDSTADIDVLVQGINSGMTELLATP